MGPVGGMGTGKPVMWRYRVPPVTRRVKNLMGLRVWRVDEVLVVKDLRVGMGC